MHPQITRQNQCKVALFAKVRFISRMSFNMCPQFTLQKMQSHIVCKIKIYLQSEFSYVSSNYSPKSMKDTLLLL